MADTIPVPVSVLRDLKDTLARLLGLTAESSVPKPSTPPTRSLLAIGRGIHYGRLEAVAPDVERFIEDQLADFGPSGGDRVIYLDNRIVAVFTTEEPGRKIRVERYIQK